MSRNLNLNVHNVTSVSITPARERRSESGIISVSRDILIETPEGLFEINLYSPHVNEDYEGKLLEVEV